MHSTDVEWGGGGGGQKKKKNFSKKKKHQRVKNKIIGKFGIFFQNIKTIGPV
jgi:hypothetical protein